MIYYVNARAPREGNGSKERPFRRISDAANIALPGDEVLVYPGVYREQVSPVTAAPKKSASPTALWSPWGRSSPARRRFPAG